MSSSLELETVLTTVITRAVRLADADSGTLYEFDETDGVFNPRASVGVSDDVVETLRGRRSFTHAAATMHRPVV